MSLSGITDVSYRLSSPGGGGAIELRAGSPTGTLVATTPVPATGGWDDYRSTAAVSTAPLAGTHTLYLVFNGTADNWFDLDSMTFGGAGVSAPAPGGVEGRTWTLTAQHSTMLMDVYGVSTADGSAIVQWPGNGADNQKWQAVAASDGAVSFKAVHSSKCLDVTGESTEQGAFLQQSACNGGDSQQFTVGATATAGVYTLRNRHSGQCVDVNGVSTAPGARLLQWPCHDGANQQ